MTIGISNTRPGLGNLASTQRSLQDRLRNLASGSRISRAAQDAAGLAISEGLRASIGGREQGIRNLSDGISATRIAEGALNESSNLTIRLRELTIQASNGTLSDGQRQVIQQEADQIVSELDRIAGTTDFNGKKLLNGDTGSDGIELVDGSISDAENISISVGDQSGTSLGLSGIDVSDPASLSAIDDAIGSLASARASLGATERRLEGSIRNLRTEVENLSAAESRIRDTDFANETSLLARDQVLTKSASATQVQSNLQAGAVLQLLGR